MRFLIRALLISFLLPLVLLATESSNQASDSKPKISNYRLPLQFERNIGQVAGRTAYIAHSQAGSILLDQSGAMTWETRDRRTVTIAPAGEGQAVVRSEEEQTTLRNYYLPDAGREYTNVPSFGRIRYEGIYPGIDLIYYGREGRLEYDFEVLPGGDPARIRLDVTGGTVRQMPDGDLLLQARGQELRFSRPETYQLIGGKRQNVSSRYLIRGKEISIAVGDHDARYALVIDPTVIYTTYLNPSGVNGNLARDIAADSSGNAYLLALTNFPFSFGEQGFSVGSGSCTVSKLNSAGNAIIYQTTVAVNGDCGLITEGKAGTSYFTGHGTIHPTAGVFQPISKGKGNFIIKLDAAGQISYATYLGGSGNDSPGAIAEDASGNVLLAGVTDSNDFPLKNPFEGVLLTTFDGFVAVLNPTGTALNFSTYFNRARLRSGAFDGAGNVYVSTLSADAGTTTFNAIQPACAPQVLPHQVACSLVAKFSPAGTLLFSTFLPPDISPLEIDSVTVDPFGTPYIAGNFDSSLALAKVDPNGASFQRITIPNVTAGDLVRARADAAGNIYLAEMQIFPNFISLAGQFVSVSPAGSVNFQFDAPGEVTAFAAGPAGHFYLAGAPLPVNSPLFYTVNPLQPAKAFPFTPDFTDVDDSYVADISAAPDASLGTNPGVVKFGDQGLNLAASSVVTLANLGSNPLTISGINVGGADFSETNKCTLPLSSGDTCTVTVSFTPTVLGSRTGTLTINSDATNAVQAVALVGNGIPTPTPALSRSTTSLTFGSTPVGGSSSAQTVQLTSNGTADVTFNRVDVVGDFQETNTCGTSLPIGANCTISVTFNPTAAGARTGTVSITDNVAGSPQTITLTGTGGSGFVLQSTPAGTTPAATVNAGQSATYNLNVNSVLGFTGAVSLNCSGAPAGAGCAVNPSSLQLNSNSSVPVSVSISTTARSTAANEHFGLRLWMSAFALLGLWGVFLPSGRTKRYSWIPAVLLAGVLLTVAGCGGGGGTAGPPVVSGTPAGTYNISISGSSGNVSQSMTVVLKVN